MLRRPRDAEVSAPAAAAAAALALGAAAPEGGGSEGQTAGELYQRWERYRRECQETLETAGPPAGLACNGSFDMYVCWDYAAPNATARASCPWYLPWHQHVAAGFVLRQCGSDGQWGPWRDHSQCENPENNGTFQAAALHSQLHPHQPVHVFHAAGGSHPHTRQAATSPWPLPRGPGSSPLEPGSSRLPNSPDHDPVLRGRQLHVAAGGGHLPAQPPGGRGRLRGGPLPLLPAPWLGGPRAFRHSLGDRQVPVREYAVLGAERCQGHLVDHTHPYPHDHLGMPGPAFSRRSSGISYLRKRGLHPLPARTGWGWLNLCFSPQINFFIFIRILGILLSKLRTRQMRCPDYRLRLARSTLTLVPLLGVHEVVFAPVTEEQARGALRLAKLGFEIFFSSFQGLLVSVLYCFINKEVQSEIRRGWHRCRLRRSLSEGQRQPPKRASGTLPLGSGPSQVATGRTLSSGTLPVPRDEASRVLESYC
ncbi:gastric inhibitory polypeptide receptor isoform X5 [Rousettus aegyptiacus]|uniref:gastric inhibitory polypeptide receptor isoform X5 n=1 Tax=Rousettus aegyptiacus TaxID=9407 RepID=UPI00168CC971|nr:gastric inhibitory polypeptide receptor isoform X5 [Rousettus aegyptiacus]